MTEETETKTDPQNERPEEACAVEAHCERGCESDWFEVHTGTGKIVHFCARHALAAEALVSLAGWGVHAVVQGLRALEGGVTLAHVATLARCTQENCPSLAVVEYDWPGKPTCYACEPCSRRVQSVASALGFSVTLRPLPGMPATVTP